jgi:DNA polymerase III alpha subunit
MAKINSTEQALLKKETNIIKKLGSTEAFHFVKCIVDFLKENELSVGYTKGSTSGLYSNYKIGLSKINPLEYGLLSERNYLQKPYAQYDLQPHNKLLFSILLDKNSFQKIKDYLKENKCSKAMLELYNIDITYDKRLDKIKNHKKYSIQQLSKLAIKKNESDTLFQIKNFNNYIDANALKKSTGLKEYWFDAQLCNKYNSLANKYRFLKTNNSLNVILFQEEWMIIIKKITGLSHNNVNLFRKALGKKIKIKEFEQRLKDKLTEKYKVGKDIKLISEILMNCTFYLPCKAHHVSDAYIDLVSGE